jgi:hypothetical protein
MASTEQDNELEELLRLAKEGHQDGPRQLSDVEKFIITFEITESQTNVMPVWAIYRGYRLITEEPRSKQLFIREFSKYFNKSPPAGYFITSTKLDTSDNAYWAEKRFEADERTKKERKRKQRYPNNYPGHYKKNKT